MNFTRWVKIIPVIAIAGLFGAGVVTPEKASVAPSSAVQPQFKEAAIPALQAVVVDAQDDSYTTPANTNLSVPAPGLRTNDTSPASSISLSITIAPSHGSLPRSTMTGTLSTIQAMRIVGSTRFSTVCDTTRRVRQTSLTSRP